MKRKVKDEVYAGYFLLQQIEIEASKPTHLIQRISDRLKGRNRRLELAKNAANVLTRIIRLKELIEVDHSEDDKRLAIIEKLIKDENTQT